MSDETQTPFTPARELKVSDLETLRVLADPQRFRLVQVMSTRPGDQWTVKEMARAVGATPTKLYYHVNLLEEHGLIVVTGSRLVSGILEKRYQVAADQLSVDRKLFATGDAAANETMHTMLSTVLDTTREDIEASVKAGIASLHHEEGEDGREPIALSKGFDRLSRARAVEFRARLKALYLEFEESPSSEAGGSANDADERFPYALMVAFYPVVEAAAPRRRRARKPKETPR
ncbi:MAG TPA: helix-turn-helix domain-containing protein [Candidatus Acidoferrum sp.]|nr:helix-turn-helix domain-containing protein [Candidatus Acidoferrum sp.]